MSQRQHTNNHGSEASDNKYYPLDAFFQPRRIAVIGASEREGSVGLTVLKNLVESPFQGEVYPVNPYQQTVMGRSCYPRVTDVPGPVDLAVIITPARTVLQVVRDCVRAHIPAAVVISAGFRERGLEGAAMEQEIVAEARKGAMRLIGPNSLGISYTPCKLNATFAATTALPGSMGFISQSGALCTAVLDWSLREKIGFSAFVSLGAMADVDWGDAILQLGADANTRSILIYMESIGDPSSFLSAAREVALSKPIIVLKAGRTSWGQAASRAHLGVPDGDDDVLTAAFRRCGVLRVQSLAELFSMAEVLARVPRPAGPRLTILTNAGGPGVLAADALAAAGGELADLPPETISALDAVLPAEWSHGNPIDILGDAGPERYRKALEIAIRSPHSDGLLVLLTPQAMTEPARIAEILRDTAKQVRKPILASWMGGEHVAVGDAILQEAGIPNFAYADTAAAAFQLMWRYSRNLRSLYETPALIGAEEEGAPDRHTAADIIAAAREAGRTELTAEEARAVLSAYHIPVPKLSDMRRYPLYLGCEPDKQFGPVLRLELGGVLSNLIEDRALGLPPLNTTLARRMLEQLKLYSALSGERGRPPVDLGALVALLVRFSHLAVEQRWLRKLTINPLEIWEEDLSAYHVRMWLYPRETREEDLPRLAIRPYPIQYIQPWRLKSGEEVLIRPIRPEDEPLMVEFHRTLSEESVYLRYFYPLKLSARIDHDRLTRVCFVDYRRAMVLVAERRDEQGHREIIGVGRLNRMRNSNDGEFAVLISDTFQGQGLGRELLHRLIEVGRAEKLARIIGTILAENQGMQQVSARLGFELLRNPQGVVEAVLEL